VVCGNKSADFGWRYNAPEVITQRSQPIPEDQLHKCDIWAFGLCVWEILADGHVYFQRAWQSNPLYERPPSYPDSWTMVPMHLTTDAHNDAHEEDYQRVFGRFDPSRLERLALEFVNGLNIPGVGLRKRNATAIAITYSPD
jgi:Protein tyrosine kinase.